MAWKDMFGASAAADARLEKRIVDLERTVTHLLQQHGMDPGDVPGPDVSEARSLMAAGQKIAAIKAYREATGAGLAEAKAAVEAMAEADRGPI